MGECRSKITTCIVASLFYIYYLIHSSTTILLYSCELVRLIDALFDLGNDSNKLKKILDKKRLKPLDFHGQKKYHHVGARPAESTEAKKIEHLKLSFVTEFKRLVERGKKRKQVVAAKKTAAKKVSAKKTVQSDENQDEDDDGKVIIYLPAIK